MARPNVNGPKKQSLTLTVSKSRRELLALVSVARGMSISALVEEWAVEEAKKLGISNEQSSVEEEEK